MRQIIQKVGNSQVISFQYLQMKNWFIKLQRKYYILLLTDFEKLLRFYNPAKGVLFKLYSILLSVEHMTDCVKLITVRDRFWRRFVS